MRSRSARVKKLAYRTGAIIFANTRVPRNCVAMQIVQRPLTARAILKINDSNPLRNELSITLISCKTKYIYSTISSRIYPTINIPLIKKIYALKYRLTIFHQKELYIKDLLKHLIRDLITSFIAKRYYIYRLFIHLFNFLIIQ